MATQSIWHKFPKPILQKCKFPHHLFDPVDADRLYQDLFGILDSLIVSVHQEPAHRDHLQPIQPTDYIIEASPLVEDLEFMPNPFRIVTRPIKRQQNAHTHFLFIQVPLCHFPTMLVYPYREGKPYDPTPSPNQLRMREVLQMSDERFAEYMKRCEYGHYQPQRDLQSFALDFTASAKKAHFSKKDA
jgi:hypothetical protein